MTTMPGIDRPPSPRAYAEAGPKERASTEAGAGLISAGHPPKAALARSGVRTAIAARRRRGGWFRSGWLLSILIVAFLLGCWQGAVALWHLESYILPSPLEVAQAFGKHDTQSLILTNITVTIEEALAGFAACLVVGVGLAICMFSSRVLRDALYPLLIASQAIPTIAIGAILVIALGYGPAPKIVVVILYSFFAVTVSVYDSLLTLDPELPAVLRTLGASPWQVLRIARLPAALPGFFTGAKLAVAYSVSGAIYGEWVGSTGGLGYALQMASAAMEAPTVLAVVVVMAALSLAAFAAVAVLERLCTPWARRRPPEEKE
ncbi:MAG TPA: ABC transporter permease [Chloroflexota bacterium]|nr:ABC transporter permease [Chloroflexota bacterium]